MKFGGSCDVLVLANPESNLKDFVSSLAILILLEHVLNQIAGESRRE